MAGRAGPAGPPGCPRRQRAAGRRVARHRRRAPGTPRDLPYGRRPWPGAGLRCTARSHRCGGRPAGARLSPAGRTNPARPAPLTRSEAMAVSAAAATGSQYLWFLSRGSGLVLLVLFSVVVVLGVATRTGSAPRRWPRFAVAELHRTLSLFAVALLG